MNTSRFYVTGLVRREIVDTVTLSVPAETENEALEKATQVLRNYPEPHEVEDVDYVYVENREYHNNAVSNLWIRKDAPSG